MSNVFGGDGKWPAFALIIIIFGQMDGWPNTIFSICEEGRIGKYPEELHNDSIAQKR